MSPRFKFNRKPLYKIYFLLVFLSAFVWVPALWNQLFSREINLREGEREEGQGGDQEAYPRLWQKMFNQGRQTQDNRPAAAHRLEAKIQARRLPLARPGGIAQSLFRPLSLPPLGPSCDWSEMGPSPDNDSVDSATAYLYGNVSGRVTSLALDLLNDPSGNSLYVGTAYGGLWKTANGLSGSPAFTPLSDPTQSLAVGAVALDNSGGQTILYVGTGEQNMDGDSYYGVGIQKSTDGGATWNTPVTTANGGTIPFLGLAFSKILVDPSNPLTILAATGFACCHSGLNNLNQGIYRSADRGASWNQVTTVNGGGQPIGGHSCTDLLYNGSATFYAAIRFQGVYASTDHGASWTQLASPFPSGTAPNTSNFARASLASQGTTLWCLASDSNDNPSQPGGADTGLSQSSDGGNTWSAVKLPGGVFGTSPNGQGTYDQCLASSGPGTLFVAGIDLFKTNSVNGTSTSWTNLTNAYANGNFIHTSHPDQHAIVFANPATFYIGNDGGVWSTTNTGAAFANLNTDLGTLQFYSVSPDPSSAGKFIGGTQDNGTALNHGNSGLTWTELDGGDGGFTDASPKVLGQFYTENFGIGLFRSDNYGADNFNNTVVDTSTITPDSSSILVPYQVLPSSPATVVLGTSRVWEGPGHPTSPGVGWSAISPNFAGSSGQYILNLAVAPSNLNYIYATTADNVAAVYQVYTNHGNNATWPNVSTGLPSGNPIAGIAVDPADPTIAYMGVQGFVGSLGAGHIFQTTNGGAAWTDITGNLPDAPVNSILVDPHFAADVYVANDVGVFATQLVNGGSTSWSRLGTTLPDSTVFQIKISETCPRAIVAATHGRGAWSICPLDVYCPPTATPTATSTPTNTPTPTPTGTLTPISSLIPTSTPTPVPLNGFSVQAQPNVADGQTPVHFVVNLPGSMRVFLGVYNVAAEAVYAATLEGAPGLNRFDWTPRSQDGAALANGIYFYLVWADDGSNNLKKIGKIYVRH